MNAPNVHIAVGRGVGEEGSGGGEGCSPMPLHHVGTSIQDMLTCILPALAMLAVGYTFLKQLTFDTYCWIRFKVVF